VNIALKLSEAGSLKFNDPDFQQFNSQERQKLFLQAPLDKNPYPQVLSGFHLIDPASGELVPRYFHLFPLWLTVFFKLWRFSGMFAANTLFGVLSVLILVPLGQRLFGSRLVGLSSAGLLANNMGQIWIVRSPFSEILAQVFLLAGIWILSIGMIENRKRYCILAGFLFGLTLFVRVDSLLILAALLIFAWLSFLVQVEIRSLHFPLVPFLITLSLAIAYASLHTVMFALPYFSNVTDVLASSLFIPSSLTFAAGFCFFLILSFKVRARLVGFFSSETIRTRTFFLLCLIVTGLFAYAYFIRPHLQPRKDYIPLPFPQTGSVRFYDEINLVRLGWYLSPLGLLLGYLGSLILLRRAVKERVLALRPFLLVLGFFSLFYLYKSRAFPENYWVIRRYVEIVIPGFLMLASLTVVSFFDAGKCIDLAKWVPDIHKERPTPSPSREGNQYNRSTAWLPILRVVSVIAFLVLAGWQLKASYPLLAQTEWEKTFSQLAGLAGANRDADVLLLERGQFQ
ncbi:MAG: hypothetical protein DMG06_20520, partial [Acidobacteria bacterium]